MVKILLKEPGLYPRQNPVTHERWIESHTNRQDNKVMDEPQVLGTVPRSTRGSTKEGRKEPNQRAKQPGSGGLSGQAGRTVRKGRADCPAGYRGLSAPLPQTVRLEPRTIRKRQQNLQRRTANNGPSAGSTRTVRQAPADCPPGTRGLSARHTRTVRNFAQPKLENTTDRKRS
jgi:hypothetical protein